MSGLERAALSDQSQTTIDEPDDGFRSEYRPETGETVLIFRLRGPGLLTVQSCWVPSMPSTVAHPATRLLMIENKNG